MSNIEDPTPKSIAALEVKLTTLPDSTTVRQPEAKYGTELVIRPDTIVFLALELARRFSPKREVLRTLMNPVCETMLEAEWQDGEAMLKIAGDLIDLGERIVQSQSPEQMPFLMQPVWKTIGATGVLADQCLDIFIWSDCGFASLLVTIARKERKNITRQTRSVFWLVKMLWDFAVNGQMDHRETLDKMVFGTKNDKAFAAGGTVTQPFMKCAALERPRLAKEVVREIILGGGEKFLSPERRLDAAIVNSRLFDPKFVASEPLSEAEISDLEVENSNSYSEPDANN